MRRVYFFYKINYNILGIIIIFQKKEEACLLKIIGRFFLALYGFVMAVLSMTMVAVLSLFWTQTISYDYIDAQVEYYFTYPLAFPITIAMFSIIFLTSFILIFVGVSKKERRDPVVINAENGQISVAIDAFESIASSTLKKITEAKEYTVKVKNINSSVSVSVKIFVVPESNIPELGKNIQAKIIEAIETTTEVKVINVSVKIENIYNNTSIKSKVE